jgi:hypothetical protein
VNTTHIRRSIRAALTTSKHLRYAALSGQVLADLLAGRVIRVSTYLDHRGLDPEFIARFGSPAGRAVAKAYRTQTGAEPLRCWVENEAGRFIHVAVYAPADAALPTGFVTYKRTREYAAGLTLAA